MRINRSGETIFINISKELYSQKHPCYCIDDLRKPWKKNGIITSEILRSDFTMLLAEHNKIMILRNDFIENNPKWLTFNNAWTSLDSSSAAKSPLSMSDKSSWKKKDFVLACWNFIMKIDHEHLYRIPLSKFPSLIW